jgi:glycosyltransferase involved in cell wall biosynthesis
VLRLPGDFSYFSSSTLDKNARAASALLRDDVDGVVFRSAARWGRVKVDVPYYVYLDAVFHTFFYNTFDPRQFHRADIDRIFEEEARFLENAAAVFFESQWGMQKAREAYSLRGQHYLAAGRGGVIDPPSADTWDGRSLSLVTIAMNFEQKGGPAVLSAYRRMKEQYPALVWHIIGGKPSGEWSDVPGITYEGELRPDVPRDRQRLEAILANAFLLVHPTREDTSPLVITEAAYFGCPAVSTNAFAIPELVTHGVTGLLMNSGSPEEIVRAVSELIQNKVRYRDMRRNARQHALLRSTWDSVGARMCDHIESTL